MIPVFCINLPRCSDRKKTIQEEWIQKRGIHINFFEGVDRLNVSFKDLPEPYKRNLRIANNFLEIERISLVGRPYLTLGEICCTISHCQLLRQLIDSNVESAVILEDDAIPLFKTSQEFYAALDGCINDEKSVDIILLHSPFERFQHNLKIHEERQYFNILYKSIPCTQATYYSRKGMEAMYNCASKMIATQDSIYPLKIIKEKQLGLIKNPLTYHPDIESCIEDGMWVREEFYTF